MASRSKAPVLCLLVFTTLCSLIDTSYYDYYDQSTRRGICFTRCRLPKVLDARRCRCVEPRNKTPVCRPLRCGYQFPRCETYKKDRHGCSTCECLCYRRSGCPDNCPYGVEFMEDKNGCKSCQCKVDVCPSLLSCRLDCPKGYEKDQNDCDICKCKPSPKKFCSRRPRCPNSCRNGIEFSKDRDGCKVCQCKTFPKTSCRRVFSSQCRRICKNGFIIIKDERGCQTCQCDSAKEKACDTKCTEYCPNGFLKDESGCETCECKGTFPVFGAKQLSLYQLH